MTLVRTSTVLTPEKLRSLLGLEDDEELGSTVDTHDGFWQLDSGGLYRFWSAVEDDY